MRFPFLIFAIICAFVDNNCHANEAPGDRYCFELSSIRTIVIDGAAHLKLDCDFFKGFDELNNSFNQKFELALTPTTFFATFGETPNASYFARYNRIDFQFNESSINNIESFLPAYIHELGHSIFFDYLAKKGITPISRLKKDRDAHADIFIPIFISIKRTQVPPVAENLEQETQLKNIYKQSYESAAKERYEELNKIIGPYNEFFSDILTVAFYKDPLIMKNSLFKIMGGKPKFHCRSMLSLNEVDCSGFEKDPHVTFYSLRNLVWVKFIEPNLNDDIALRETIHILANVFTEEIRYFQSVNYEFDIEVAQQRLSSKLNSLN